MVEFDLKINKKQQTAYFSNHLLDVLGYDIKVQLMALCGVVYPKNSDKKEVVRSLKILLADLEHQIDLEIRKTVEAKPTK